MRHTGFEDHRRVAITGVGVLSPLGQSIQSFEDALFSGRSGIAEITSFETEGCRTHRAGKLRDFEPADYIDPNKLRRIDEVGRLAVAAGGIALAEAGIASKGAEARRVGVVLGTFTAGLHSTVDFLGGFLRGGPGEVSPMLFSNTVGNAPASLCALEFGLRGGNVTVTHKEASSLGAIGYAVSLLRHERASAFVTGGVDDIEANFFRIHDRFRVMSPSHGDDEAARPFDTNRNGFVLGEGGYALVVESWPHARARGAAVRAEILGVGGSSSPSGINQWPKDPGPLARSMELALEDADCSPRDIDVVYASANGSEVLDRTEARSIRKVFGGAPARVVSIKGAIGESGASGAASVIAAIGSLREGRIPPTVGLRELDPECPVNASPEARPVSGRLALVNSFASGGANYSVVISVHG